MKELVVQHQRRVEDFLPHAFELSQTLLLEVRRVHAEGPDGWHSNRKSQWLLLEQLAIAGGQPAMVGDSAVDDVLVGAVGTGVVGGSKLVAHLLWQFDI